jgi:hypothetical protein
MSTLRPLPPRPSLEYARKEAKALLRRLRAGDPDTRARARAVDNQIDTIDATRIQLAHAQLVLAREHGFASWPRLVRYIGDVERQQQGHIQLHGGLADYEAQARSLLAQHRARDSWVGRSFAAYVPRFYGVGVEQVFASAVSEDEARLAVARGYGAPSWDVLVERLEGGARSSPGDWQSDPMPVASDAIAAGDLTALERIVAAHPQLLTPSELDMSMGRTLMRSALWQERKRGVDVLKPVMDWLRAHGFDRQRELNLRLCGYGLFRPTADDVRATIDQGADPNWIAPNGIPVLEHALLRYWNPEGVDELAAHARPREALWIAAGLGDVDGVRGFLDDRGWPTAAARRLRPDGVAVGRPLFPPRLPDASDEEILVEALVVAILNGRTAVIEYLASRGAPLDSVVLGMPPAMFALNRPTPDALACLVRCGADLDLRSHPNGTPRELVRTLFEQAPQDPWRGGLVAACGMDADAMVAEINARPVTPPELDASVQQALALAREDAARLGQPDVRPENLLIGLLRAGTRPIHILKNARRMEVERFRTDLADRLEPEGNRDELLDLPMHADAQAVLERAIATAAARRQTHVDELYFLHALTALDDDARTVFDDDPRTVLDDDPRTVLDDDALTARDDGAVARFLARYGVSAAGLHADLGSLLLLEYKAP